MSTGLSLEAAKRAAAPRVTKYVGESERRASKPTERAGLPFGLQRGSVEQSKETLRCSLSALAPGVVRVPGVPSWTSESRAVARSIVVRTLGRSSHS